MNRDRERQLETEIVEVDHDWNDKLDRITAESWGLTLEEFREFRKLKTNAEMEAFMKEHQKK